MAKYMCGVCQTVYATMDDAMRCPCMQMNRIQETGIQRHWRETVDQFDVSLMNDMGVVWP